MTNKSNARKGFFSFLAVVFVIAILMTYVSPVIAGTFNKYDVEIVDGASSYTITTSNMTASDILTNAGITLGANDKLDTTEFEEGNGGVIKISRLTNINVDFDNKISSYNVYATNVGDALDEIGATVKKGAKINYSLDAPVANGMVIELKSPSYVYLKLDGKKTKYAFTEGTVGDLLAFAGVELGEEDYTKPSLDTMLKEKMTVKVFRVEYKTVKESKKVKYSTKEIKDSSMYEGQRKTVKKGVNGSADVTYRVKYVNGKEDEKLEVTRVVVAEPVKAEVKVGTKKSTGTADVKPNGVTSKNGFTVGQEINGKYSHYCACSTCNGNSRGITTSGKRIHNGMSNPYYIACNWLPLGSVINVDGKNYTVVDRGGRGLSKVGRIDIFTPEGHSACYRLGVGSCKITIVRLGW